MFPFTSDLQLNEVGIQINVEHLLNVKSAGIGFGFSEPWVSTHFERKRAFEVVVESVRSRVPTYMHTTDHSVESTINLSKHAANVGADAVMIWAPYEWARNQQMICDYFEHVASKIDIAIILCNTPQSGILLTPETVASLAKIPNICALKNDVDDATHTIRCADLCGDLIVVSNPREEYLLSMIAKFNQQVMLDSTSVFLMQSPNFQPIQEYFDLALNGNFAQASSKFQSLESLRRVWRSISEVLLDKNGATNPIAYIKYWMELNEMSAGPVRPPMKNLSEAEKIKFCEILKISDWQEKLFPNRKS